MSPRVDLPYNQKSSAVRCIWATSNARWFLCKCEEVIAHEQIRVFMQSIDKATRFLTQFWRVRFTNTQQKWIMIVMVTVVYVLFFYTLWDVMGFAISIGIIAPIMVSAWLYGMRTGLTVAILALPFNALLISTKYNSFPSEFLFGGVPGHLASIVLAFVLGRYSDMSRALRQKLAEQHEMELTLRDREEKYRLISENLHDLICLHQLDGTFTYVSPSVTELFGYEPEALIGKSFRTVCHPNDVVQFDDPTFLTAVRCQEDRTLQYRIRTKDGKDAWVETKLRYVPGTHGEDDYLQSLTRDITRQRQFEQQIRQSEAKAQRLALVAKHTHNGVIITDAEGRTEWINEGFTRMTGYTMAEMVGEKPGHLLQGPDSQQTAVDYMNEMLARREPFNVELINYNKVQKAYWVRIECQPLFDETGTLTGFMAIESNITERKQYEAALKQAKEKAEEAARAKSEFLANMSHEIRTPMNAIIGLTGLLLDTELSKQQQEFIETLRTSGNSLLLIINDILDFSKIEAGKLEIEQQPFNLHACVQETIDLLSPKATQKELNLNYHVGDNVPRLILGDATRVRQVLVNLVGNAVKFTETGQVVVAVNAEAQSEENFEIQVSVQDTGIGIPRERMDRLFASFSQVDASTTRRFGGTGLGLVISKRLVEAMNGRIWVESEPGRGSTFSFTFLTEAVRGIQRPQAQPSKSTVNPDQLRPLRILLAEDNAINQKVALRMLERIGYRADVAGNGLEAVAALKRQTYDVVLMDVQMPEMDGEEATRHIRLNLPTAQQPYIIALTANALKGDRERFLAAGMDDYLSKPVRYQELAQALTAVPTHLPH